MTAKNENNATDVTDPRFTAAQLASALAHRAALPTQPPAPKQPPATAAQARLRRAIAQATRR